MIGNSKMIGMNEIDDERYQTRLMVEDEDFEDLVKSVKQYGVLQPVICKPVGDKFEIIAGHRRFAAARACGQGGIPAILVDRDEDQTWAMAIHENLFRKDLTAVEEAAMIKDCLMKQIYSMEGMAKAMGRTQEWIGSRISMCDWPDRLLAAVHLGKLSVSAARNLALIEDEAHRDYLLDYAVENGATARITAAWLQAYQAGVATRDPEKTEVGPGPPAPPAIEPHTPCIICSKMLKMVELTYLPICPNCNSEVLSAVRAQLAGQASGGVV